MNQTSNLTAAAAAASTTQKNFWLWGLLLAALALLIFAYWDGLVLMVKWWEREEYSHGYMIPLVALFLFWQKVNKLSFTAPEGSWLGAIFVAGGIVALIIGKLSLLQTFVQYGFLLSLTGIFYSFFGNRFMRLTWVGFAYLAFMIPLPSIIYGSLSEHLQLISSQIGVAVIRLFGISVFLEGNVIDLGPMQLQVAEACSGLRYLFPLLSFGFLIGYLFCGPKWQRIVLFLSAIPITVLMNSFRIGIIGVTVDKWGIEMAEGFLHDFEGWVVFMGCVGIMFLEIAVFHIFSHDKTGVLNRINLDIPEFNANLKYLKVDSVSQRPFLAAIFILAIAVVWSLTLSERAENTPNRKSFSEFPDAHQGWSGKRSTLEPDILHKLKLSDYIQSNYWKESESVPVNFYIAWYSSQRSAAGIHSPRACLPGGGWIFDSFDQIEVPGIQHVSGIPLRVNRALIRKEKYSQLVYYWYDGRNRDLNDEYVERWHIFWDLLLHSRSDGALVRLVTMIPEGTSIEAADQRLQEFLKDFYPLIPDYVP